MDQAESLREEAIALHRAGRLSEAEQCYHKSLEREPGNAHTQHRLGTLRLQQGRTTEALALLGEARRRAPQDAELVAHHGLALHSAGQFAEALMEFDRALALHPDLAMAHSYRGNTLRETGRSAEALASYDRLLTLAPDYAEGWYARATALWQLERGDEALASYERAVALNPGHVNAWYNLGLLHQDARRYQQARVCSERVLRLKPDMAAAWNNLGMVLLALRQPSEARACCERSLALEPGNAVTWNNRGTVLRALDDFSGALESFDRAVALDPGMAGAHCNRGILLITRRYLDDALASLDRAISLAPEHVEAWYNRGAALQSLGRYDEALQVYEKLLTLAPDHPYAPGSAAGTVLQLCDFYRHARYAEVVERLAREEKVVASLTFLGYSGDETLARRCAENYLRDCLAPALKPLPGGQRHGIDRLRIAYLSSDFHEHATAHLLAGVIEHHDRFRFEVTALNFGQVDDSAMQARLRQGFDHFLDARDLSDGQAALLLRDKQIDIAIDLKGHTQGARPGILARRPAPVQVQYLGYPGTMGSDFIDYVIADATVLPFTREPDYAEKIVHLPHCYQANDDSRIIAASPSRAAAGLPQTGFVFCCFNASWKIAPDFFDAWMRLLAAVPGSVLWLMASNDTAVANLKRGAAACGVDPTRLIFAPHLALPEHLARYALADLFLDTLPYNAHTTASDALWAGLPLVTCCGSAFPGRVGASMLRAIGLDELVTHSLADYEARALALAHNAPQLAMLRRRLADNRRACPLFDTKTFTLHLEEAYQRMAEIARRGGTPQSFSVPA